MSEPTAMQTADDGAQEQMIKVETSDGKQMQVSLSVAKMSVTIKNMLEDLGLGEDDEAIPLPNVTSSIMEKVIEYCEHHKNDPKPDDDAPSPYLNAEIKGFDADFVRDVDQGTLFQMILAANFLDIKPMLDLTCKTVADMIRGKTPEEIRQQFNIVNDFTPEEQERVRKENEWCEDRP